MKTTKEEMKSAIEQLKRYINQEKPVYTMMRHVSKSGMYRVYDVYVVEGNEIMRLTWSAATAIGARYDKKHEGIGIKGCGFDGGFDIVYHIAYALGHSVMNGSALHAFQHRSL